jgi:micrococcal nuclease
MRVPLFPLVLAFTVFVLAASSASAQDLVRVKRVIDGDTMILESGERIQLIGVNIPETKPLTKTGNEAAEFTKRLVEGKLVQVEVDHLANTWDRWSPTLTYVFLEDGTFLNAEIIRQGYGLAVSAIPPLKYDYEFQKLEREARKQRRGLWADATK